MQNAQTPQQPQFVWSLVTYVIVDAIGVVLFATGALWLAQGEATLFTGFPADTADALMTTVSGLLLTTWAASRIIGVLIKRPTKTQGKAPRQ